MVDTRIYNQNSLIKISDTTRRENSTSVSRYNLWIASARLLIYADFVVSRAKLKTT